MSSLEDEFGKEVIHDLYSIKISQHIFPKAYPNITTWDPLDFVLDIKELVCDERLDLEEKIDGILMGSDRYKKINPEDVRYV